MNHCMIDIETLGTAPGSVVLAAGIVVFGKDSYEAMLKFNLTESLKEDFKPNHETLKWWEKQGFDYTSLSDEKAGNEVILVKIASVIDRYKPNTVWGCGPQFDMVLLESYYRHYNIPVPWRYGQLRCFRTMRELFKPCIADWSFEGIPHNPLDDAKNQVRQLQKIMNCIKMTK